MIASLPMYDTPATRDANDRLWQGIRERLGKGPTSLEHDVDPHVQWLATDLVLSQTCGLPYRTELAGKVQLVGTPDYGVEGCQPGYYNSCIVVRKDDPRSDLSQFEGARLARNDVRSQSGWAAIERHLARLGLTFSFEDSVLDTGAHADSARAVSEGKADLAALDAVTWALLCRDTDIAEGLRVLDRTVPTPGLPFITSLGEDPAAVFNAVSTAIQDLSPEDRETLRLKSLVSIPHASYLVDYGKT